MHKGIFEWICGVGVLDQKKVSFPLGQTLPITPVYMPSHPLSSLAGGVTPSVRLFMGLSSTRDPGIYLFPHAHDIQGNHNPVRSPDVLGRVSLL